MEYRGNCEGNIEEKVSIAAANNEDAQKPAPTPEQLQIYISSRHWGKVKPFMFHPITFYPRITLTTESIKCFFINLLIIVVVCLVVPMSTNVQLLQKYKPRLLDQIAIQERGMYEGNDQMLGSIWVHQPMRGNYVVDIFAILWAIYQLAMLVILILINPGHASIQNSADEGSNYYHTCSICQSMVDNSVFHCRECDLCCDGWTHHCVWIGKCIGNGNKILLKGYVWGFLIGGLAMLGLFIYQSWPTQ